MTDSFDVTAISSPGEILDEVAKREGVETHAIRLTRTITPVRDLLAIWKLFRLFRQAKPTIVHTHTPKAGMVGMIASKLARVPIRIHTVAGLPLETKRGLLRKILIVIEKITYACANHVFPNSFGLLQFIEETKLCKADKLKIIGEGSSNGIDIEHFQRSTKVVEQSIKIREELGIARDDLLFCFIGRLVRDKGIEELMWAFEQIAEKYPQAKLLLVGKFEEHLDPLSASAKKVLETHPRVHFVGYQNDVRPYLAASDIFVFPSYREGLPNVLLQAGAMGVASIATRINGSTDIVEDQINGILVEPQDRVELLTGMERVLTSLELRNKITSNSRELIVEKYDQRMLWQKLLEEYQEQIQQLK